ncbi:F-box/kelch-repeat protein SKIP30 [Heracleum sosnowskyi]|uniref:F-box/kelch-repeat protein SKIP30 n=1 Tax=Heracleum sosnowskyi TaxID=360622 RepID=A0AAD8GPX4_9APIA|nr:F-box/kelch-repeat protein SKIP30 [Heracleum sosnowskyi]
MSELIEGLPDAVALRCLARVPFYLHPKLELVSRSWRAVVHSAELFKTRQEVNSTEDFLCVCAYDPENLWQLYDPLRDLWITLPVLPSQVRHLAYFGAVSTAGKLFVLGGGSDAVDPLTGDHDGSFATDDVWSYDPVTRQWAMCASMLVPRAMFACCVLDGVVIGGKMHVLHKGLSTVQIYDKERQGWIVYDCLSLQGPMAVVKGEVYVMSHGLIQKQVGEERKVVVSASEFRRRIGFAMTGMGDDIYIIGRVIGPERWNWDITFFQFKV